MSAHVPSSRSAWRRARRLAPFWYFVPLTIAAAGLIIAAVLIASGCTLHDASAEPAPPTLRLRLAADPLTLDPASATDENSLAVVAQIFDGLVDLDPATGEPKPALAASWDVSDAGRTYTFHLRPGARFHSHREIESSDVVYSFERLLSPEIGSERRWVLSWIRGAEHFASGYAARVEGLRVIDKHTIAIDLEAPNGSFLSLLALEAASIVPREVYADTNESYLRAPDGAGPFLFKSWDPGRQIVLAANAGHHGGTPSVQRVVYRIIPSVTGALEEYLAGGLDLLDEVPDGRRKEIAARLAPEFRHSAQPAISFIAFNHARPPFRGNRALRQALNYAIDRESLCRALREGRDLPADGILPPGVAGHDTLAPGYTYDPERAQALLVQAGYPGGRGLTPLTLGFDTSETHRRACERIRSDLADVGVKVVLRQHEPGGLMRAIEGDPETGSDLHLFLTAWQAGYPDPDAFLTPTLHSTGTPRSGNFGRYANLDLDRALQLGRSEPDPAKRMRLYREAERIAVEDAPWIFLYFYGADTLVKPYVQDFQIPAFGGHIAPLHQVTLAPAVRLAGFLPRTAQPPRR